MIIDAKRQPILANHFYQPSAGQTYGTQNPTLPRRVLVTGATSDLGIAIVAALKGRGDQVVAFVRPTSTTDVLYRLGVTLLEGDITDAESVASALRDCDAVIHAAAKADGLGPRDGFDRVNVLGTRNVARTARAQRAKMVHVSSASVYGTRAAGIVTEETTVRPSGLPYPDSKIAAEQAVLHEVHNEGLWAAMVRPPLIYGPGDRTFLPCVAASLRRRAFVYTVDPKTPVNLAHMQHVVEVILAVLEHPRASGEAFNVCDGAPVSLQEIVRVACRHVGAPLPRLRVPTTAAHWAATALESVFELGHRTGPLVTHHSLQVFSADYTLSIEKARRMLSWEPTIATVRGIAQACEALT